MAKQRNKSHKTACSILNFSYFEHMVNFIFGSFTNACQYGCVTFESEIMGNFHNFQPFITGNFFRTNFLSYIFCKNLRTTAGKRAKPCIYKFLQNFFYSNIRNFCQIIYLYRGKSLNMCIWQSFFTFFQERFIVFKRPVRV